MAATFATTDDVQARTPYREIPSAGADAPNVAIVGDWLDQAETRLVNTLASVGIAVSASNTTHKKILAPIIIDVGEGRLRKAYAAAGGDGQNDDGKDLLEGFEKVLKDIRDNPNDWAAELGGTPTPGVGGRLRGPVSGSNGCPMFTMEAQEDQF